MIKVYNLKNKKEYIEEVATLEYEKNTWYSRY